MYLQVLESRDVPHGTTSVPEEGLRVPGLERQVLDGCILGTRPDSNVEGGHADGIDVVVHHGARRR